ncbi:MAG: Fic family protein [Clostridiales bacterium]|nr:Fic family protein [Clostridiales bacterium]
MNTRAGKFVKQSEGFISFVPSELPPNPPINLDDEMQYLLSLADRKLGRLDGVVNIVPDPELFVSMYVLKEAVLSSQIEGTQASLMDVLADNNRAPTAKELLPAREVVRYIDALEYGLKRLDDLPLSLRLIREIHGILLADGRGSERNPGEFRSSQNWIGEAGCPLMEATFVPPTVPDMFTALNDLEAFLYDERFLPPLIKIALIHAQFETIHPFLDGNGRMGRLLITFWLCQQQILTQPLLYLSYYFKFHKLEYYDRLMAIRLKGDWEGWIKFFLKGISHVADESVKMSRAIFNLKKVISDKLNDRYPNNNNYQRLLTLLFSEPVISRVQITERLGVANETAGALLRGLEGMEVIYDMDPERERNKRYIFKDYIDILQTGTELADNN